MSLWGTMVDVNIQPSDHFEPEIYQISSFLVRNLIGYACRKMENKAQKSKLRVSALPLSIDQMYCNLWYWY